MMTGQSGRRLALVLVLGLVTATVGAGVTAAQDSSSTDQAAFTAELAKDGDATVTITSTYDLSDPTREAAYEELATNETAQDAYEARVGERMATVAADASAATGREMTVSDVELTLRSTDGTGVAELSVTWEGFAAVDGDQLVVTEPIASGLDLDRPVVVVAPDGYAVADASPAADAQDGQRLTWNADTDLQGFDLALADDETAGDGAADDAADDSGDDADGGIGPGFGLVAGLAGAIAGAALLARRRV